MQAEIMSYLTYLVFLFPQDVTITYNMANTKIIVGLSGGVDSAVAALLLKEQGYEVTGVFMKNWEEDDTSSHCTATKDLQDAQDVCNKLNIQLHTANFAAEYWDLVFSYFLQEYKANRTPNPDILCNKEIKFKTFLEYAKLLGADFIATGHYATKKESASCYLLAKGIDQNKDQSYFLHALNQEQLKSSIFPLGNYTKQQVRERAKQAGFKNHQKKIVLEFALSANASLKNSYNNTYLLNQEILLI